MNVAVAMFGMPQSGSAQNSGIEKARRILVGGNGFKRCLTTRGFYRACETNFNAHAEPRQCLILCAYR